MFAVLRGSDDPTTKMSDRRGRGKGKGSDGTCWLSNGANRGHWRRRGEVGKESCDRGEQEVAADSDTVDVSLSGMCTYIVVYCVILSLAGGACAWRLGWAKGMPGITRLGAGPEERSSYCVRCSVPLYCVGWYKGIKSMYAVTLILVLLAAANARGGYLISVTQNCRNYLRLQGSRLPETLACKLFPFIFSKKKKKKVQRLDLVVATRGNVFHCAGSVRLTSWTPVSRATFRNRA